MSKAALDTGPELSEEVAALFQVEEANDQPKSVVDDSPSLLLRLHEEGAHNEVSSAKRLPSLDLDRGHLSPCSLLGTNPKSSRDNQEAAALNVLDNNPPESMLFAAQRLRSLSTVAERDVQNLGYLLDDAYSHLLPERCRLALKLLLESQTTKHELDESVDLVGRIDSTRYSCHHFSAIQLVLAEIDPILESLIPPEEERRLESHWRIRDLMTTVRSKLGFQLSLVLHVLVGPLNGICLRNLVWHGYVGPGHVQQWAFLLWLIVGLGLAPLAAEARKTPSPAPSLPSFHGHAACFVIPDEKALDILLCNTSFVPSTMQSAFKGALHILALAPEQDNDPTQQQDGLVWRSLALLFTVLESAIRNLYAHENRELVQEDICLARTDRLHITMSTMLLSSIEDINNEMESEGDGTTSKTMGGSDNRTPPSSCSSRNRLHFYFCEGALHALFDEFVWMGLPDAILDEAGEPEEPMPCRNELVHGVVGLSDVSPRIAERVAKLSIGLTAFCAKQRSKEKDPVPFHPRIETCLDWLVRYEPRRHPACQVWSKFRLLTIGSPEQPGNRELKLVQSLNDLLGLSKTNGTCSKQAEVCQDASNSLLGHRLVEYCPICSLPLEYCCYTASAVKCLEQRFGPASSISLNQVFTLAARTKAWISSTASYDSETDNGEIADEAVLSTELLSVRQQILEVLGQKIDRTGKCNNFLDLLQDEPPRRSTPESELNKLWMVRETILQCHQMMQDVYRRMLYPLAEACCGRQVMRIGRKKEPILDILHRFFVILQTIEILLLMAFHQYVDSELTSIVFPTFLSMFANTMATFAENGRFKYCIAMSAGLVLKSSDTSVSAKKRLTDVLPPADRPKFALDVDKYLLFIASTATQKMSEEDLIKNKFALNSAQLEAGTKGATWFGLRRWQRIATSDEHRS